MPETTPAPTPPPKTDTILAEQSMSEAQALRAVKWVQSIDFVIMGLVALVWLTLLYWHVFASPTPLQVLSCCLVAFALVQLWVVILIFRCSHFVLLLTAQVNLMPEVAARMVVGYYSGRTPPPASQRKG